MRTSQKSKRKKAKASRTLALCSTLSIARHRIDHIAKPGCLAKIIAGSYPSGPSSAEPPAIWRMVEADEIPAYNVPFGKFRSSYCILLRRDMSHGAQICRPWSPITADVAPCRLLRCMVCFWQILFSNFRVWLPRSDLTSRNTLSREGEDGRRRS